MFLRSSPFRDPLPRTSLPLRASILSMLLLLVSAPALAVEYDTEIDVQSEEEIAELYDTGEISEEQRDTLIELLQVGVELNTADREDLYELPNLTYGDIDAILEYRKLAGRIDVAEQLVAAGAIDAETLRKLMPFIIVNPNQRKIELNGSARLRTLFGLADDQPPGTALNVRARGLQGVRAGVMLMTTRYRLGEVSYDPLAETLVADPAAYSLKVPKFYAQWNMKDFSILAGTYTLGFGEKLTLSNSTRRRPSGFYADDTLEYPSEGGGKRFCYQDEALTDPVNCGPTARPSVFRVRDYRWSDRFRGLAANVKDLRLGTTGTKVDLSGFGSYQTRSVYQYSLMDRSACEDPRDPDCSSPPVYERVRDPSQEAARYAYQTLPDVYDELFGGANVLFKLPSNLRIGVVGWGAAPQWRVSGINLDVSDSFRVPFGGPYGAVGSYASYGLGRLNLSAEVTRSFDSSVGNGGGFGVLQRNVLSAKKRELELTLRYYDKRFDNPYASPPSGSDMFEGARARNEAGVRVRYLDRAFSDWNLRGTADFWILPEETEVAGSAGKANVDLSARAGFIRYFHFAPELWVRYRKGGIGRLTEDEVIDEEDFGLAADCVALDGSSVDSSKCASEKLSLGSQLTLTPTRWSTVRLKYTHAFGDNGPRDRPWIQDRQVTLEGLVKPIDGLRLRARTRFKDEDLLDVFSGPDAAARGETSFWSTLDATYWVVAKKFATRVRYDNYLYVDSRPSTAATLTNPFHAFRLELEGRY